MMVSNVCKVNGCEYLTSSQHNISHRIKINEKRTICALVICCSYSIKSKVNIFLFTLNNYRVMDC